jgi:hypothetical protein
LTLFRENNNYITQILFIKAERRNKFIEAELVSYKRVVRQVRIYLLPTNYVCVLNTDTVLEHF